MVRSIRDGLTLYSQIHELGLLHRDQVLARKVEVEAMLALLEKGDLPGGERLRRVASHQRASVTSVTYCFRLSVPERITRQFPGPRRA